MRARSVAAAALAAALLLSACGSSDSGGSSGAPHGDLVVFAAASLDDTFTVLARQFESAHDGIDVVPSFGGSDTLAAQITQGAPVDVFASANLATMRTVVKAGDATSPVEFVKNELEIAVEPGNPHHIKSLADVAAGGLKLAMCATSVPCGSAAAKAFAAAGITPHAATLEQNVTSVLTKVELGEADAGIVYRTDVKAAGSKVTGIDFPQAANALNTYSIAQITTGKNAHAAQEFISYVRSPAGQRVLLDAGFQPVGAS